MTRTLAGGLAAVTLALVCSAFGQAAAGSSQAPFYNSDSVVNAASNESGFLAPNTLGTIYGRNLALATRSVGRSDISAGAIPTALPGAGARVSVDGISAGIIYASPAQINFLVPADVPPGPATIIVTVDGLAGPPITETITPAAPGVFLIDTASAAATHADGTVISAASPAAPAEVIVVYATGLGDVVPRLYGLEIPDSAALVSGDLQVLLNNVPVDAGSILYAGITPGFGGLYQVNIRLPDSLPADPDLRITVGGHGSRSGAVLHTTATSH